MAEAYKDLKTAADYVAKNRTDTNDDELFIDENCFNMFLERFEPLDVSEGYKIINH